MEQSSPNATGQSDDCRSVLQKQLRDSGLRVTAQRLAVLNWLAVHPHANADEVRSGVQQQLGSVSLQAVYGVLAVCTTAGLLRRIDPAGHSARFECRVDDNHHHMVCRNCGRIEDTDCAGGESPCLTPADDHGFVIDEAEVVFWGICPRCRIETTPEHGLADSIQARGSYFRLYGDAHREKNKTMNGNRNPTASDADIPTIQRRIAT